MFTLSLDGFIPRFRAESTYCKKDQFTSTAKYVNEGMFLEVFLVCDGLTKKERKGDFSHYFTKAYTLKANKVFFYQYQALEHLPFLDDTQGIVRAFVPERAVKGHGAELSIDADRIPVTAIHGCYPAWTKGKVYYPNTQYEAAKHVRKASQQEEV